jgi:hypothetical protein
VPWKIGMESIDGQTLASMRKNQNKTDRYHAVLYDPRRRGVRFSLNFIFGWDTETRDVFSSTLRFLEEEKVPVAYFNLPNPVTASWPHSAAGPGNDPPQGPFFTTAGSGKSAIGWSR